MDVTHELNHARAVLIKDLERAAKYAAVADRFSKLSSEVQLPDGSVEIAFGFRSGSTGEIPSDLGAEVRDEFASYSARFSVLAMITAFEVFVVRVLWIAKVCQWVSQHGLEIPTAVFYKLGQEARATARHTSVHRMVSLIGEQLGKAADFPSAEWFRSVYAARSCLTHRGGIVGPEDAGDEGKLRLVFRAIQFLVDSVPREKIHGLYIEAGSTISIRFTTIEREIPVGESLALTPQDCQNIALSIAAYADDTIKTVDEAAQEIFHMYQSNSSAS